MYNNKGNGGYNGNRGNSFNQKVEFDFEKKGYLKDGIIREELITEEAEKIAKEFNNNRLSTSQLRAFFNEVKAIKNRVKDDGSNYNMVFPLILMLKSKAEYKGSSKGNSKIPAVFKDFLIANIDRLSKDKKEGNSKVAFDAFVMFFEAVVGYFYGVNGGR